MDPIYAGVDQGGTNIKCAFADAGGNMKVQDSVPTRSRQGPKSVPHRIAQLVTNLAAQTGRAPAALGIGVPAFWT
jgi:predicted NBD/HSP70 family sugar kinase